jgi:Radical SAM superfamily/4Fe-4S single cluster domain
MQSLLAPDKFQDPNLTAKGQARAQVGFKGFKTLWFNTGTLCNITCVNCYIESSPTNDRLVYLNQGDIDLYLDELDAIGKGPIEIGFTGGEPFLNPDIIALLCAALERGHDVLMLTNAMRPMMRPRVKAGLTQLITEFGPRMTFRISLDHWSAELHDTERGQGGFEETCDGVDWLVAQGAKIAMAGRTKWGEDEVTERLGYQALIAQRNWPIDLGNPLSLILFPEMDDQVDVPEITPACWGILGVDPNGLMCATSRMVVKRKGASAPVVLACTLLPYDSAFEMGQTLDGASTNVKLNHPHCAKFCVLGGGSCSA